VIEEIDIRDLGVIARATLPLGPGFTAITGETGAGKTMVVTALGLLLGERSDSGVVRSGAKQASTQGRWLVASAGPVAERVREAGGELDDVDDGRAELLLGRSVSAEGRSRATVGGQGAPVGVLAEVGAQLVVVHGQSEQIRLKSVAAQRQALDRYAGAKLHTVLEEYRVYRRLNADSQELDLIVEEHDRRQREADDLRLAIAEIEAAAPQPGEDAQLTERAERLTNREELRIAAASARESLSAETIDAVDVTALIDGARRELERASAHDSELAALASQIEGISFQVSEIAGELSSYLAGLDEDGARELEIIQERRAELNSIVRKYGPSLEDALALLESGSARLLELDSDDERIEQLRSDIAEDQQVADTLAGQLSALRRDAAAALGTAVSEELSALAMAGAQLVVDVTPTDDLGPDGRDAVAILLKPHSGTEPRPIARGASGGELSRVMLALEVVIAGTDPVPTFVFDEVDAGVGGAAAIEIGRRLQELSRTSQVIVVTHLAQVAAFAHNHLSVVKGSDGSVTASSVRQLEGDERAAEMARLLSGLADSESGLAHARELLEMAHAATA
jgi:DNA repair protein RecN (Recombination protein N)